MEQNGGSSSAAGFQYDVFLSFRGKDTRHTFTRNLYDALQKHGIQTFMDSEKLETGEWIAALMHKIEVSEVFVAVISENYADSKWCLREIAKMVDCGRRIIPVFYGVEVDHVKKLEGKFGEAFIVHENAGGLDGPVLESWKAALKAVCKKKGHVVKDSEASFINKIVNEVSQRVRIQDDIGYSVGINERVDDITQLLALEDKDNVRIVWLYGMDGIGKTTLAKAVCNRISGNFDACSFLEKIKEKDLCSCQMRLLEDILKCREDITRVSSGKTLLRKRLPCKKKALIILDDVNQKGQMDALAGDSGWFGRGSRIIITTSNLEMTTYEPKSQLQTRKWVHNVYEVKKLNEKHSLELLSYHAFKGNQSEPGFEDLLKDVVRYACNLPLALEILGGLLRQRDKSLWKESIDGWKKSIPVDIKDILELSYSELKADYQSIFLDIACLFIGVNEEIARHIWEKGIEAIEALSNRCLIKINHETKLEMHDLIREMGMEIVRKKNKYSRLWRHNDVMKALDDEENTRLVEGINLMNDVGQQSTASRPENSRIPNLGVLRFKGISFCSELIHPHLKWMEWHASPLGSLSSLKLQKVVVLDLSHGKIVRPWKWCRKESQVFNELKVLNLSGCGQLRSTEGLSTFPEMKLLILEGCSKLKEIHPNIEKLNKLALLNMKGCRNLVKLPDCFSNLKSLKTINFSYCCELQNIPDSICYLPVLRELLLAGCSKLRCLPDALGCLKNLEILIADHCKALEKLPRSIGKLHSLQALHLKGTAFTQLPDSICALTNLRELDLSDSKLERLPTDIGSARSLSILALDRSMIEKLPDSIDLLGRLVKCSTVGCSRLLRMLPS